jgi:hypothetical protein
MANESAMETEFEMPQSPKYLNTHRFPGFCGRDSTTSKVDPGRRDRYRSLDPDWGRYCVHFSVPSDHTN